MKIIDLLNKIANGEEAPIKFKYQNYEFTYSILSGMYVCDNGINPFYLTKILDQRSTLNDEIEIIEEDKDDVDLTEIEVYHQYNECLVKDKYYQEQTGTLVDEIIIDKLNDLIRYVKKDKED